MSETFSMRLKKIRDSKGWTQQQFADKIGCSRATYNHYENGNRHPDDIILRSICQVTHVSADYLLGLTDTENPRYDSAAKLTGFSEKALDYLQIKKNITKEAGSGIENAVLDFIICDAWQTDIFDYHNPNPFLRYLDTQWHESQETPAILQQECNVHILDTIKEDWIEAEKKFNFDDIMGYYKEQAGETEIFIPSTDDFTGWLTWEEKEYLDKLYTHPNEDMNNAHFLDKIVTYLLFDKYDVSLCSSQGQQALNGINNIFLKFGNTKIEFPSETSSQLIEDMLVQDVVASLKKLKENYKKKDTEQT